MRCIVSSWIFCWLLLSASATPARAELTLHGLFTDHAVLQQGDAVPVWGTTDSDEPVVVALGEITAQVSPAENGRWTAKLALLKAGGPHILSVTQGDETIQREDIHVGEVWLCSGQSNMAWKVSRVNNAKQEIAAADWPQIRMFNVPRTPADQPRDNVPGNWMVCSPQSVGNFSATAYFFGRKLRQELNVPIGLINASVGGTPIEAWTSLETHKGHEQLQPVLRQEPDGPGKGVAQLYNGMIAPLAPFALRGAIWYQGERNTKIGQPYRYRYQLPAMIGNWRELWQQPPEHFPFLFVQLPNYMAPQKQPVETSGWVLVREGMFLTLNQTPNTGMAVTVDIGEAGDIHPRNKQDVGKRLALWALGTTYGKDIVHSGPLYTKHQQDDGAVRITFDHVGDGLKTADDKPLAGFAIAGEDRKFVWAEAEIAGPSTVLVRSAEVANPVAVRYSWAANPRGNLVNSAGLPASPLRTDDWRD